MKLGNLSPILHGGGGGQSQPSYAPTANTGSPHLANLTPDQLLNRYEAVYTNPDQQRVLNGEDDQQNFQAYQNFVGIVGRRPTANEFSQALPAFRGGIDTGRAYLSQLAQSEANSPANLQKKAPQFSGQVNDIFQQLAGRGASQEELNHFGSLLATGQVDPYQIQQFVNQLPEVQSKQDASFRQGLQGDLLKYNQDLFNRSKGDILSAYGQAGIQNSPSLDYAMTDLLGKISSQSTPFLANLTASQYGGNKQAALNDYQNTLSNFQGQQTQQRNIGLQNMQNLTDRGFGNQDYRTQMGDYMNFLNANKGRSTNPLYGAIGGLVGAGAGGFLGGPAGAGAGYQVGSGLGNSYGYLNS